MSAGRRAPQGVDRRDLRNTGAPGAGAGRVVPMAFIGLVCASRNGASSARGERSQYSCRAHGGDRGPTGQLAGEGVLFRADSASARQLGEAAERREPVVNVPHDFWEAGVL